MQDKLNILVPELGPSQKNYFLIRNLNAMKNVNVNVFVENLSRFCITPSFAVMNIAEAWGQPGTFIATNLSTASKLMTWPVAKRKLFYVWDLEFLRQNNRIYDAYAPIYLHKEFELICRSEEHSKLITNALNKEPKYIIENFDLKKIMSITNGENQETTR